LSGKCADHVRVTRPRSRHRRSHRSNFMELQRVVRQKIRTGCERFGESSSAWMAVTTSALSTCRSGMARTHLEPAPTLEPQPVALPEAAAALPIPGQVHRLLKEATSDENLALSGFERAEALLCRKPRLRASSLAVYLGWMPVL